MCEIQQEIKQALIKIDFFERVKNLSEKQLEGNGDYAYNTSKVFEMLDELGYHAKYDKREKSFEINEEIGRYMVIFQFSLDKGYLDAGWYLYKENKFYDGDVWQMLSMILDDRYEDYMKPAFKNYEEMKVVLREALLIYEDFKQEILNG